MGWLIHYPAPAKVVYLPKITDYKEKGARIVTSAGIYCTPRIHFKTLFPVPGLYFETAPLKDLNKSIFVCLFIAVVTKSNLVLVSVISLQRIRTNKLHEGPC